MRVGDIVEHIDKESKSGYPHDKEYLYKGVCRMKNPTTGEWADAAVYCDEKQTFVRELNDFNNKFKKVI